MSMVPEIQNTSLQTIQQLAGKHFYELKPQVTSKLKSIISLETFQQEVKSDRIQCTGINSPVKA